MRAVSLESHAKVGDAGDMKTMVDLDRDVLREVQNLAAAQKKTPGQVLSELVRRALPKKARTVRRNGIRVFAKVKSSKPVNSEVVNRLIDKLM